MGPTVRVANASDVPEMSRALALAFADDPIMGWLIGDSAAVRKRSRLVFATMARHHFLEHGRIEVAVDESGAIGGAAMWTTPGHWNFDDRDGMRMVPSFIRAFRTRVNASRRMAERMATHHPAEPHWYLMFLGTRPAVRGKGFGHVLLTERLRHCDETGSPAYLESSKPDNVPYYERFGFEVVEQLDVTEGGPPMWSMWRAPRAQSTEP